jgi:hypothetical protein
MSAVPASSYASVSVAVAYTVPLLGAFSWTKLGDYWSSYLGALVFYSHLAFSDRFTTIPGLDQSLTSVR